MKFFSPFSLAPKSKGSGCHKFVVLSFAVLTVSAANQASAADWTVRSSEAVFAVVTHKTGIAAKFAHDHLIVAQDFTAAVSADEKNLEKGTFKISLPVDKLEVDSPALKKKWYPTLESLSILSAPFADISESDRATVRENMLKSDQLDAAKFPTLTAEMTGFLKADSKVGKVTFDNLANIQITIKNKTVKKQVPAKIKVNNGVLEVEATLPLQFSMFEIAPYSAMFGAVGNSNDFNLYVNFKADKK